MAGKDGKLTEAEIKQTAKALLVVSQHIAKGLGKGK